MLLTALAPAAIKTQIQQSFKNISMPEITIITYAVAVGHLFRRCTTEEVTTMIDEVIVMSIPNALAP